MPPDFPKTIVDLVAKRSAYYCSNPDCGCQTVGANSDPEKSTSIGEAAHIFGARPGSRRFREDMVDFERSAATNAICLCTSCHTKIDRDDFLYPADLLFLWKIKREASTTKLTAKAGDILRSELDSEEMRQFTDLPLYSRQLIATKPNKWEPLLVAELMQHFLTPVLTTKTELEAGLYTLRKNIVPREQYLLWLFYRFEEITAVANSLCAVVDRFMDCMKTGNPSVMRRNCELFAKCGERFLELAEEALFTQSPEGFSDVKKLLPKGALFPLDEMQAFPQKLKNLVADAEEIFSQMKADEKYIIHLEIGLPPNWSDEMISAIETAKRSSRKI